ncbi:MAG: peptidase [Gammaproteobacteria bacterium]|nr:MAG: peptidase [Gammaproteobacteria bacterium]
MKRYYSQFIILFFVTQLIACGGGGGGGTPPPITPPPTGGTAPVWTAGVYESASSFINQCQNPRSGTDLNGNAFPDQQGTTLEENHWLRSWSNNTYLWYSELPDINPAQQSVPTDYFDLLKTSLTSPSGNAKDKFHFYWDTAAYQQLTQTGVSVGYGIDWELTSATIPRALYIRTIEPGSPADAAELNLTRGVQILEIDGVVVETTNTQAGVDTLNAGMSPSTDGESHVFTVLDVGSSQSREVTISATEVTSDPVPMVRTIATETGNVGYLLFNDHNFVSEDRLYESMTILADNNVNDLVLDLRYNGGGLLYIASQLSYMIAGSAATTGQTFDQLQFNDKHPEINPVTSRLISPTPFYTSISSFSDNYAEGTSLPQLNLDRVFILSTAGTCSASEAIINGLRGIDIEVILIGDTTCGKPYGFYPTDNCGTTYFTIQFDGVNQKGVGGYSDGFSPMNAAGTVGELVTGCSVEDDLSLPLGEENDPLVAAALDYRITSQCPTPPTQAKSVVQPPSLFNSNDDSFNDDKNGPALRLPLKINQKIYLDPYTTD